jgi:Trk K+ transport system NAD-binding subunit
MRRFVRLLRRNRHVAWLPPAGLAAVTTGYLAWGAWRSAHAPAWLYRDDAWWRVWLRPDHDGAMAVFVMAWLLAGVTFWWPRRRQSQETGLVVTVAMVLIGTVLGTASLAPCRGGQSRAAVIAWVLNLFTGNLEPQYGSGQACPGQMPLALQIGRAVCLGATLAGALTAAAVLWRQPAGRLRARLVKDATILTGLDAMTVPLLRRLAAAGSPKNVVVIEPDQNHPLLEEARNTGAHIVVADPTSQQVLLPLLRGLRGPQLRYLFALRPEAGENEAVLAAARSVLERISGDTERPPHLIARIDDPRHADVWRGQRIGASPLWFEDALSPAESTARTIVQQVSRAGARQVLLCGDSTLALAVLLEFARRAWERRGLAEAAAQGTGSSRGTGATQEAGTVPGTGPCPGNGRYQVNQQPPETIVIVDRRAGDLRREYLATSPPSIAQALLTIDTCQRDWREHLLAMLDKLTPAQAAQTVVLIASPPSDAGLHEAGRIARLHPGVPVFVLMSDGAGVADTAFDRLRPFQRAFLVDHEVPEDSWTRIARYWHECYRLAHAADAAGRKRTRGPWEDLDSFIREDNILQLRSIMAAVARLGRQWVPSRAVAEGSFVELSDTEIGQVAREEHRRWYDRRRKEGWRAPGEGEEDDDELRINSNVRPWEELAPGRRERACEYVRSQLGQLEAAGFMPALPDGGPQGAAEYQRVGEVQARRLVTGRAWRNTSGDELLAAAGDWLVTDEMGSERTVRDTEFRASHAPLAGNRWRRTGTVRAWRVTGPVVLRTMEGNAVAQPGDWIVQGAGGERWPVHHDQFVHGYRPLHAAAGDTPVPV